MSYDTTLFDCGFAMTSHDAAVAAHATNADLHALPALLWQRMDLKATSGIVGAFLAHRIAEQTGALVNPVEKGHPDILPSAAAGAPEAELRTYHQGLEIKVTCGQVRPGAVTGPSPRFEHLSGITWQAHHQQVGALLGVVWDFVEGHPKVTAAFYSASLQSGHWGAPSGLTGRSTKVCGLLGTGRALLAGGPVCAASSAHLERYSALLLGRGTSKSSKA